MRVTRYRVGFAEGWIPLPPGFEPVKVLDIYDPYALQDAHSIVFNGDAWQIVPVACGPAAPYPALDFRGGRR